MMQVGRKPVLVSFISAGGAVSDGCIESLGSR